MRYHLKITISYSVGSCHDDRKLEVDKGFKADNRKEAIEKSKKIIQNYHKMYSFRTDYGLSAELSETKLVWETHFEEEQPAEPAVPAQPARKAIAAHFKEKKVRVRV